MLVGGAVLSLLHAPWKVQGTWDVTSYVFTAFILIFGTLAAFYLYITALRLIGAQKSSLLTCAEPLSAAVLLFFNYIKSPAPQANTSSPPVTVPSR